MPVSVEISLVDPVDLDFLAAFQEFIDGHGRDAADVDQIGSFINNDLSMRNVGYMFQVREHSFHIFPEDITASMC